MTKLTRAGLVSIFLYQLTSSARWPSISPSSVAAALPVMPCGIHAPPLSRSDHLNDDTAPGPTWPSEGEPDADCVVWRGCPRTNVRSRRGNVFASSSRRAYAAASTPCLVQVSPFVGTVLKVSACAVAGVRLAHTSAVRPIFQIIGDAVPGERVANPSPV